MGKVTGDVTLAGLPVVPELVELVAGRALGPGIIGFPEPEVADAESQVDVSAVDVGACTDQGGDVAKGLIAVSTEESEEFLVGFDRKSKTAARRSGFKSGNATRFSALRFLVIVPEAADERFEISGKY